MYVSLSASLRNYTADDEEAVKSETNSRPLFLKEGKETNVLLRRILKVWLVDDRKENEISRLLVRMIGVMRVNWNKIALLALFYFTTGSQFNFRPGWLYGWQ